MTYKPNSKVLALSFLLTGATFVIYLGYFDILAPAIPDGSVRANSGMFFALPVMMLLTAQTLVDMGLTHISVALSAPEKKDALKAYFVASFQVLLFSVFYVIFPFYGPYTYVVDFMPGQEFGRFAYPILIAWTLVIIFGTTYVTGRIFRFDHNAHFGMMKRLLLAAATLAIILVTAS